MAKENPNQNSEKFKVVIFIGKDIGSKELEIENIIKKHGLDNVKIINSINMADLSDIKGKTDENTMFIVAAHGINKQNRHYFDGDSISGKPTDEFLNNLQIELEHNINATLFSCHGGGALKMGKIDEGISLMVRASSKYSTDARANTDAIIKILQLKVIQKDNLSNQEIYAKLLKEDVAETFYYRGGNANDKTIKYPRIGKYDLEEIKDLLKKSEFPEDQQNKIYEAFKALEEQKKTKFETSGLSFSIAAIKRKIKYLADDSNLGLDKTFCDNFIKKLKRQHAEKSSLNNAEVLMQMRDIGENKTRNLDTKLSSSYENDLFRLAISRKDTDLIKAIFSRDPDFSSKYIETKAGAKGINQLSYAALEGSFEIFKILIKKGASAEELNEALGWAKRGKDNSGMVGFIETIKSLQLKPTNIDLTFGVVDDENVKEITKLLKTSTFLTEIDLSGCDISDENFKYIAALLEKNTSLTYVGLRGIEIGDKGTKALAKALEKNTTLTNIDFSDSEISKDQLAIIQEYLDRNKALQKNKAEQKKENISGEMQEKKEPLIEGTKEAEMKPLNIHIPENVPDTNPTNPTSPKNKNDKTEKQK